jgi:hypothetical protein
MEAASDQMGIGNPLLLGAPSSGPSAPGSASGSATAPAAAVPLNWNGLPLGKQQPPGAHPWPAGPTGAGWHGSYAGGPPTWAQPDGGDGGGSGSDDANPDTFYGPYNPNGATRFSYPGAVWVPTMAENTGGVIISGSDNVDAPPGPPAPQYVVVDSSTVAAPAARAKPVAALGTVSRFNSFLTGRKLQGGEGEDAAQA